MKMKRATGYNELAEEIKRMTGAELITVRHAMDFCTKLSTNKEGKITMTLKFDADVLANKGDIRKWKGQLLLLWIELPDKKEFKYL